MDLGTDNKIFVCFSDQIFLTILKQGDLAV